MYYINIVSIIILYSETSFIFSENSNLERWVTQIIFLKEFSQYGNGQ